MGVLFSRRQELQDYDGREAFRAKPDIRVRTAHDWESYRRRNVDDDATLSFFRRPHTITVLIFVTCVLLYVALLQPISEDSAANTKHGVIAMSIMFIIFGVMQTSDGPFWRPHPILWRLCFSISLLYELGLVYVLFQSPRDARLLLRHLDPTLGVELPEKDYGGDCSLYDSNHTDPYHNIWDKMDGFVPTHFFGWWLKTMILRDWWLCMVISVMFEILEYTLEHQLPNFSECWWDHWIMDALLCNGMGIFLGMITLKYLKIRPYHWRGLWQIPTYTGRLKRVFSQFTPYSWMEFDWRPLSSFRRWIAMLLTISVFLFAELNTFYLKYVLWIPPNNNINLIRLVFFLLCGGVAMRETFEFMDNPNCKKFGKQAWVILIVIITEILIVVRFDLAVITKPLPTKVANVWMAFLLGILGWTVYQFFYVGKFRLGFGDRPPHDSGVGLADRDSLDELLSRSSPEEDEGATVSFRIQDLTTKDKDL